MSGKSLFKRSAAIFMAMAVLASVLFGVGCQNGQYAIVGQQAKTEERLYAANSAADEVVSAVAEYDFSSASFDESPWAEIEKGNATVTRETGTGLILTEGIMNDGNIAAYTIGNPLKEKASAGFSVIMTLSVTGAWINQYESIFGFTPTQDPSLCNAQFFCVAGGGLGMHLNRNGETGQSNTFYDILAASVLDMSEMTQYILTVDASAIRIYANGTLRAGYPYSAGVAGAYNYDTLGFVNKTNYFHIGCADNYWGQPAMTVQNVSFYSKALSEEEIVAINSQYADFSVLEEVWAKAEALDFSNYDTSAAEWQSVYDAYLEALQESRVLNFFTAAQEQVNAAATALSAAMENFAGFYLAPDLSRGLFAAYPLCGSGKNILNVSADEVQFMNGNSIAEIGPSLAAVKQKRTGVKLFDEKSMHPRDRWDTSKSSTTGLKIPADAFNESMMSTGMTITVSIYAESLYNPWARIFQLGSRADGDGYADGTGVFWAYEQGTARINYKNNDVSVFDTYVDPFCTIIAGEWITATIVFNPYGETVTFYLSSATMDRMGYEDGCGSVSVSFGSTEFAAVLGGVIGGSDNWIGRSYWSSDGNQVAYASGLSVYSRALSYDEVILLHATDDLSVLVS